MSTIYPHISSLLQKVCGQRARILELGCGPRQYGKFSGNYYGIDIQHAANPPGPHILGDAQQLPIQDQTFDAVFIIAALLLIPDTNRVLAECHRVLCNDGIFIIFDYNWWIAKRLKRADKSHQHQFSTRQLYKHLLKVGFSPCVHRDCVPISRNGILQYFLQYQLIRTAIYPISNWIVVSGTKK